jgi:hypothetical protein
VLSNIGEVDARESTASPSFGNNISTCTSIVSPRRRTFQIDDEFLQQDGVPAVPLIEKSSLRARTWSSYSSIYDSGDDDVLPNYLSPQAITSSAIGPRSIKYNTTMEPYPNSPTLPEKKYSLGLVMNCGPNSLGGGMDSGKIQSHRSGDSEQAINSFRNYLSTVTGTDSKTSPGGTEQSSSTKCTTLEGKVQKGKSKADNPMDKSTLGSSRRTKKSPRELEIRSESPTGRTGCRIRSKRRREIAFLRDDSASHHKNVSSEHMNSHLQVVPDCVKKSTMLVDHPSEKASTFAVGLVGDKRTVQGDDQPRSGKGVIVDSLQAVQKAEKAQVLKETDMTAETSKETTSIELLEETRRTCNRSITPVGWNDPNCDTASNRSSYRSFTPPLVPRTTSGSSHVTDIPSSKNSLQRSDPFRNRSPSPAIDPFRQRQVRSSTPPPNYYQITRNKTQKTSFGRYFPKLETGYVPPLEEKLIGIRTRRVEFADPTNHRDDSPTKIPCRSLSPTLRKVLPASDEDMPPIDRWGANTAKSRMKMPMSSTLFKIAYSTASTGTLPDKMRIPTKDGGKLIKAVSGKLLTSIEGSEESISHGGNTASVGGIDHQECTSYDANKAKPMCDTPVTSSKGRKRIDDLYKEHQNNPKAGGTDSEPLFGTGGTATNQKKPNKDDRKGIRSGQRRLSLDSRIDSVTIGTNLLGCRCESATNAGLDPREKGSSCRNVSMMVHRVKHQTETNLGSENTVTTAPQCSTVESRTKSDSSESAQEFSAEVSALTSSSGLLPKTSNTAEVHDCDVKRKISVCSNDSSLDLLPWRPPIPSFPPIEYFVSSKSNRSSSVPPRKKNDDAKKHKKKVLVTKTNQNLKSSNINNSKKKKSDPSPSLEKTHVDTDLRNKLPPSGRSVVSGGSDRLIFKLEQPSPDSKRREGRSRSVYCKRSGTMDCEIADENKGGHTQRPRTRSQSRAPSSDGKCRGGKDRKQPSRSSSCDDEVLFRRRREEPTSRSQFPRLRRGRDPPAICPEERGPERQQPNHRSQSEDPKSRSSSKKSKTESTSPSRSRQRCQSAGPNTVSVGKNDEHTKDQSEVLQSRSSQESRTESTSPLRLGRRPRRSASQRGDEEHNTTVHSADTTVRSGDRSGRRRSSGPGDSRKGLHYEDDKIREGRIKNPKQVPTTTTMIPVSSSRRVKESTRSQHQSNKGVMDPPKTIASPRVASSFCSTDNRLQHQRDESSLPGYYTPQAPKKKSVISSSSRNSRHGALTPSEFLAFLEALKINE